MEIKKHDNKKKIIIAVIIVVIVAAVAVSAWFFTRPDKDSGDKSNTDTTQEKDNDDQAKDEENNDSNADSSDNQSDQVGEQSSDQDADNDPTNGGKTPPRYEGGSVQDSETLTGDINGISVAGDNLSIRVTINQYISDPDGRCDLTLTSPTGATYDYWSELVQNPQSTSCYGWDIPLSDFGGSVSGHWSAKIVVNGDGRTGTFTQEVDL